ncbi:hypothetical protein FKM82_007953 [Ascaphus truei]
MEATEVEGMLLEAKESMEAARNYRRELQQRLLGLTQARGQIKESAAQTRDALQQHFLDVKRAVTKLLDERLGALMQQVDAIEQENIKPLDDCQKLLEQGVSTAEDLLKEGEIAVSCKAGAHQQLCNFTNKALHIQLDSLPEIPSLVEVPCLSAQLDDSFLCVARNHISSHCMVASRAPVQIEALIERPGGRRRVCGAGLPAAVSQERLEPLRGRVCGVGDGIHSAAHRPQRGLSVPGWSPGGGEAGVESVERPPTGAYQPGPS